MHGGGGGVLHAIPHGRHSLWKGSMERPMSNARLDAYPFAQGASPPH
jgi:hypothetical protein